MGSSVQLTLLSEKKGEGVRKLGFIQYCNHLKCNTNVKRLNLKAPSTIAADNIYKFFSLFFRENETRFFK